jgi:predicted nuclease of predicted toxin-antitoxin system
MGGSAIWPRLEDARRPEAVLRLGDKIFIDECLSAALVSVAKDRGIDAVYGPHVGKGGWQDRNIVRFALDNDYMIVTNNRRDFMREYANFDLHNGLIIIVPNAGRQSQIRLFSLALDAILDLGESVINKIVEVLEDGSIHIREWTRSDHDLGHADNPTRI